MGILRWFSDRFFVSEDPPDPDLPVEVAVVRLFEGPTVASMLESAGLHVTSLEAWNFVAKTATHVRILVPFSEVEPAQQILADLGME